MGPFSFRQLPHVFALALTPALVVIGFGGCKNPPPKQMTAETRPVPATVDPLEPRRTITTTERDEYLGNEACVSCHEAQSEQLRSHHARTLAEARADRDGVRFRDSRPVMDDDNGVEYRTKVDGENCILTAKKGKLRAAVTARYAMGSGNRGVTYLGEYGGQPVELRLSYYRTAGTWQLTPGQQTGLKRPDTPIGRIMDLKTETDCYLCHTTALVEDAGRLDPGRSLLGVGCEACHGPGRRHVDAVRRKDSDLLMAKLSENIPDVTARLCTQCHRSPESVDPTSPMVQGQLPRLQGAALGMSECFKKSAGKLTCLSCHDPHRNADTVSRAEHVAVCVSCHSPKNPSQIPCPRKPEGDCIPCHMPVQTVVMPTRPKFSTHLIKVWNR